MSGCHNTNINHEDLALKDLIKEYRERLIALEESGKLGAFSFMKGAGEIDKRIKNIEELFRVHETAINDLQSLCEVFRKAMNSLISTKNKKPHKCPVCRGHGKLGYPEVMQDDCNACDGKGIVWDE